MGFPVGECAIGVSAGTCAPEDHDDDHSRLVYVILFVWCTAMFLLLAAAVWMGIKRIRAVETDAGHLALQVAQADTTLGEHMAVLQEVQRSVGQLRNQVTETCGLMEMLADSGDGIRYGLVEIGGFAQHRELTPVQRRHMFTVEQGNRVAMNAMGHAQYMSAIRHQSKDLHGQVMTLTHHHQWHQQQLQQLLRAMTLEFGVELSMEREVDQNLRGRRITF